MNSKQRLLAAIHLERPDRTPCSPLVGPGMVAQMSAHEWEALLRDTDVTMTVSALGDDAIWGGKHWLDHAVVTAEGPATTVRVETPWGALRTRRVATPETSWVAEHFFKGPQDIERLFSVPYEPAPFDLIAYRAWEARLGEEGLVALGIPSAFRFCLGFFGPQQLYFQIADDPDGIERMVAAMNERLAGYVEACCRAGVRSFWMGGSEHCGPGVVHPRIFRRMIAPYDRRIVGIIHRYGGIVNLHTHGKLRDILDDVAEIGVDVISPIESGLRGDVTLAEVKARVGGRLCLKGNLDDMAFVAIATEDEVRQAAYECLAQAARGGGYILSGTDANVYHPRWVQNFLAMAEVARDYPVD